MFSVALSPGRPESRLATILPFGVRTFLLSPLSGRRGDRLARSGRYLYTVLLDLRIVNFSVKPSHHDKKGIVAPSGCQRLEIEPTWPSAGG